MTDTAMTVERLIGRLTRLYAELACQSKSYDADAVAEAVAALKRLAAMEDGWRAELEWIAVFADVRSKDDSKTFARVNRGALRTIRDRANAALSPPPPEIEHD